MMTTTIAGIAGSLRRDSYNRLLLNAAARMLPADVEFATADMLDRIPPFNEDWEAEPAPVAVAQLRRLISQSDALLIATPEYNGSIPGQLKNALDWASRPRASAALQDKPAAVISASTGGRGAASAAADLRRVLKIAGATVIETGLALPRAFAQFTDDGQLADPALEHQLHLVIAELIQAPALRRLAA
jgi:chromate reductase, NAD(P)H dehydrogenase (quinone)